MDKSNLKETDEKSEAKKVKSLRAAAIAILCSLMQLQSQEQIGAYDYVRMPSTKQFKEEGVEIWLIWLLECGPSSNLFIERLSSNG